jgi:hypothetical protein
MASLCGRFLHRVYYMWPLFAIGDARFGFPEVLLGLGPELPDEISPAAGPNVSEAIQGSSACVTLDLDALAPGQRWDIQEFRSGAVGARPKIIPPAPRAGRPQARLPRQRVEGSMNATCGPAARTSMVQV